MGKTRIWQPLTGEPVYRMEYDYDDKPGQVWEIGGPDSMYPLTLAPEDWRTGWVKLVPAVEAAGEPVADPVKVELAVMGQCLQIMSGLPDEAQHRAVEWVKSRLSYDRGRRMVERADEA